MDEKLAWAFAGGFFVFLILFGLGEKKEAIMLAILLITLFILTIYLQYKKFCPKKVISINTNGNN